MRCICGLSFNKVDWLHNRKRGYCSIKCRHNDIMGRFNKRRNCGNVILIARHSRLRSLQPVISSHLIIQMEVNCRGLLGFPESGIEV